jgi:tetratricopeptide (TPR) repeat protein
MPAPVLTAPSPQRAILRRRAAAVEAEVAAYPQERAECLLEAAHAWRLAGDPERAIVMLAEWPSWTDPLEAGHARVDTAESLYALGRVDDAEQLLAALRADRPEVEVCNAAAELLAERGELQAALRWYDLAVSSLSAAELTAATAMEACFGGAALVLRGRADVRSELALGADVLDRSVPDPAELARLLAEGLGASRPRVKCSKTRQRSRWPGPGCARCSGRPGSWQRQRRRGRRCSRRRRAITGS